MGGGGGLESPPVLKKGGGAFAGINLLFLVFSHKCKYLFVWSTITLRDVMLKMVRPSGLL